MPDIPLPGYDPNKYLPGEELLALFFTPMELDARARRLLPPLHEREPFRAQSDRSRAIINAEITAGLRPEAVYDADGNLIRRTQVILRMAQNLAVIDLRLERFPGPIGPGTLPTPITGPRRVPLDAPPGFFFAFGGVPLPIPGLPLGPGGVAPPSGFVEVPPRDGVPIDIPRSIIGGILFPGAQDQPVAGPPTAPLPRPKMPPPNPPGVVQFPPGTFPDELFRLNPPDP